MSQRLFHFHGNDQEYIEFLQNYIGFLESQWAGYAEFPIPLRQASPSEATPTDGLQVVQYQPNLGRDNLPSRTDQPQWKKELRAFLSALPAETTWGDAREKAGIRTPLENQSAVRLMLGYAHTPVFQPIRDRPVPPSMLQTENPDLVKRGYDYAGFVHQCAHGLPFRESVVSFQSLIFVSYCVVMKRCGISKETTNHIMRRYFVRNNDDKTLGGYCGGVVWMHRCIAELLANGWGHKSWEVFLLGMVPDILP